VSSLDSMIVDTGSRMSLEREGGLEGSSTDRGPTFLSAVEAGIPTETMTKIVQGLAADQLSPTTLVNWTYEGTRHTVPGVGQILAWAAVPQNVEKLAGDTAQTRTSSFRILQLWEGYVIERGQDSFVARLVNKTDVTAPDEEAEIFLSEVDEADQELVKPGATFYWTIGYRDPPRGKRERTSSVWFRRLGGFTEADVERAKERAKSLKSRLAWD
jgi:hypothetical protein